MTVVLTLESGVWKVVHWHTSAPQEDDPAIIPVELILGLLASGYVRNDDWAI